MVTTRSGVEARPKDVEQTAHAGEKRTLPDSGPSKPKHTSKSSSDHSKHNIEHNKEDSPAPKPLQKKQKLSDGHQNEDDEHKGKMEEDLTEPGQIENKAEGMEVDKEPAKSGNQEGTFEFQDGILEKGHIYFFYRTKVDLGADETPTSIDDVARLHMLLVPRLNTPAEKKRFRFIVLGKKKLPDPHHRREVLWGAVEKFGEDFDSLDSAEILGEKNYTTKTRGDRHIEPARVAGRGHYAVYSPKPSTPSQRKTYLAIHLTHPSPDALGDVQETLNIYPSASYHIQVKNPTSSNDPPGASLQKSKRADYGEGVIDEVFGGDADSTGRKFVAANPIALLDYQGAEVLIIAAGKSAEDVLEEKDEKDLAEKAEAEASNMSSESVLKELELDEATFPCNALEGDWL